MPRDDQATPALAGRPRILLVDDDVDAARLIGRCLHMRYEVLFASDGMEGLDVALRLPRPDLVITDVTMPRLDGITMVQRIRAALPEGVRLPIIFLTARGEVADVIAGIQSGARHYLTKPVELDDLERKVRRILSWAHA